jgi:hypothetical protein
VTLDRLPDLPARAKLKRLARWLGVPRGQLRSLLARLDEDEFRPWHERACRCGNANGELFADGLCETCQRWRRVGGAGLVARIQSEGSQ